ncbi:hypothetical protein [Gordonia shandongensis]|uniref:hypothetical protein n=1 Tax=Gordonia shandongensis TaxID=376351 RepID=UPI0003F853F1|nr:hypothetical protein [Gordonia shandongensis]
MRHHLDRSRWEILADEHRRRIDALIGPYRELRAAGERHPVIDFLFTYYSARPARVTRWHPGFGTALCDAHEYDGLRGYRVTDDGTATVSDEHLVRRRPLIAATLAVARATADRAPRFGCFGLHEWAMVYRTDRPRHPLPLRLGVDGTNAVVESHTVRCTHYDAFRFFTDAARPLNTVVADDGGPLTRAAAITREQPGCLHATMDLYRYALALTPLIPGSLLADSFALAFDARSLDMRAGPYDLTEYGYSPVPIETPEGRARYVREQAALTRRGVRIRAALVTTCEDLLERADALKILAGNP